MKIGDTFEAEAFELSFEGKGIVKTDAGFVFFVDGLWSKERAILKITKLEKTFGEASLVELLEPHPQRVQAPCPHHGFTLGRCGGCSWQFMNYSAQLEAKEQMLNSALKRSNRTEHISKIESIVPSEKDFGYRNRASLKSDGTKIGFLSKLSNELVGIDECLVLNKKCADLLTSLQNKIPNKKWKPKGSKKWTHFDIDDSLDQDELRADRATEFRQANDSINSRMKVTLTQDLEKQNLDAPVLELFCGNGNLSEVFFEQGFNTFIGVELSRESVIAAAQKFPGYVFHMSNIFFRERWKQFLVDADQSEILVLDPPREGFEQLPKLVEKLPSLQNIFYISCNLQSWLHDTKPLFENGWQLERLQAFDMFPQTPHFELYSKWKAPITE